MIISIELSSYCTKGCSICSRSIGNKHFDDMNMSMSTFNNVLKKIPKCSLISAHGRGSSEQNPNFEEMADKLSLNNYIVIDTNGDFLRDINYKMFSTVTVSAFNDDYLWEDQLQKIIEFKEEKKNPRLILRINGTIKDPNRMLEYIRLFGEDIVYRQIHSKKGSYDYNVKKPIRPEYDICLCLLTHPTIWADGNVSSCIRYDYDQKRILGNINVDDWNEMMTTGKRKKMIEQHIKTGNSEYCTDCSFRGIPTI